jgi:hypothetical protein
MVGIEIIYSVNDDGRMLDYAGDVESLVKALAADGLSNSTVSLILRLVSTIEELALHQEQGFVLDGIECL